MSHQTPNAPTRVRRRATRQAGAAGRRPVDDAVAPPAAIVLPLPADPPPPPPEMETETDATEEEYAPVPDPAPEPQARPWLPLLIAALVLIAAAAPAVTLGALIYRHHSEQSLRDRYVQFANAMMLELTAYKPNDAAENMKVVANGSSGDFRDEVDKAATNFPKVLEMAGVSSEGRIAGAGVESADGHGATVLVAENLSIKDIGNDAPTARVFRFRVTIQNNNGNLTVSQMEMVS